MNTKIRPIMIEGNVAYVTLTLGNRAIIDVDSIHLVDQWNWHDNGKGYATRNVSMPNGKQKKIKLHHVILSVEYGFYVDHINGNTFDNRIENLRSCTPSQNMANRRINKNNVCGLKGVHRRADGRVWKSQISVDSRVIYLGSYRTPEEAHAAYAAAAIRYYGEFARIE
jgi:hypothetical protein